MLPFNHYRTREHEFQDTGLRSGFKASECVRGQGVIRFKSGAYTVVCEYFEPDCNAVMEHKMRF